MFKYSDFKLQPLKEHKFKLLAPVKYKDITIPAGFRTDGATIPRCFWCFYPPNRTDYIPAAIIHDYLCSLGEYRKADEYFKEALTELHIDKFTIFIFYNAVRFYHFLKVNLIARFKRKK